MRIVCVCVYVIGKQKKHADDSPSIDMLLNWAEQLNLKEFVFVLDCHFLAMYLPLIMDVFLILCIDCVNMDGCSCIKTKANAKVS